MATKFKIPLQSEVSYYMQQKKSWPKAFCDYYAERFWNHYQASGWKLSSGNAMKDWRAAFNSQWQILKFKEDLEFLQRVSGTPMAKQDPASDIERLEDLFAKYCRNPTLVPFTDLGAWYDFMKVNRLLVSLTPEQIEDLKKVYNNDNFKCRCACVQKTFDLYANNRWSFTKVLEAKRRENVA